MSVRTSRIPHKPIPIRTVVGDGCDNCADDTNSDQADGDVDGVGDVCDICPEVSNPGQDGTDSDGDGQPDTCDNCPSDANADQADADSDGVGDVCDNCDQPEPGSGGQRRRRVARWL